MIAGAVADDLTGALEVGALAAAEGLHASVLLGASPAGPGAEDQVVVVDAETRRVTADRAARFEAAVSRVAGAEPWLFVKLDSTLRGAVAEHLAAVARRFAGRPLVYVPAYPALRRTVVDGVLHVDGLALTETVFARDGQGSARSSSVLDVFDGVIPALGIPCAGALSRRLAAGSPVGVLVCDAGSEAELDALAAVVSDSGAVVAGSGGFASRWVRMLPGPRQASPTLPAVRRPLVVCGSRHPASLAQAAAAEAAGIAVVRPSRRHDPDADPDAVAVELADRAVTAVARSDPDAIVVFGGDTAFATLMAFGCHRLTPLGEVLPGIPVSRWDEGDRVVITKAGGFGGAGVVGAILDRLAVVADR